MTDRPSAPALAALTGATFALGLGELVVAGILPSIAGGLGVSVPVAGQLTTVYALVFAVLSPFLAAAFGGANRKRGLIIGLAIVTLANALAGLAPTFATLLAARVLAAVGSSLASPLAIALVNDVIPERQRGRAQGIVFAGFSLALTVGVPAGAIVAEPFGWRAVFVLLAVLCAFATLLATTLRVSASPAPTPSRWTVPSGALTPAILRLLAISLFFLIAQYTVFTYVRPLLVAIGGYDTSASALLLFLFGLVGIAGNIAGGVAVDRWGIAPTIIASIVVNGIAYAALLALPGKFPITALLFVLWSFASWALSPGMNVALAERAGAHRDVALALNMTAFNLGIALGSAVGGVVIASGDVRNTLVLGLVMLGAALAIVLLPGTWRPREANAG
jgi:DHA1 family inner membrane transport protein